MFTLAILRLLSFCFGEYFERVWSQYFRGSPYSDSIYCVSRGQGETSWKRPGRISDWKRLLCLTYQPSPKTFAESTKTLNYGFCFSVLTQRLTFSERFTHTHTLTRKQNQDDKQFVQSPYLSIIFLLYTDLVSYTY